MVMALQRVHRRDCAAGGRTRGDLQWEQLMSILLLSCLCSSVSLSLCSSVSLFFCVSVSVLLSLSLCSSVSVSNKLFHSKKCLCFRFLPSEALSVSKALDSL